MGLTPEESGALESSSPSINFEEIALAPGDSVDVILPPESPVSLTLTESPSYEPSSLTDGNVIATLDVEVQNTGEVPADLSAISYTWAGHDGLYEENVGVLCDSNLETVLPPDRRVEGCQEVDVPRQPGTLTLDTRDKRVTIDLDPPEAGAEVDATPVLELGKPVTLGPDDEGASVEVTLNEVSYPSGKQGDRPSANRVYAAVEMTVRNIGNVDSYGTTVYPNFVTSDGRMIEDVGWEVAPLGVYGGGEFSEELTDTVQAGRSTQGWALYEVPKGRTGFLEFPYGPSPFQIRVNPPVA